MEFLIKRKIYFNKAWFSILICVWANVYRFFWTPFVREVTT